MGHGEMRATVYAFQRAFPFCSRKRERGRRIETATKGEREWEKGSRGREEGDTRVSKDVMREKERRGVGGGGGGNGEIEQNAM